MASTKDSHPTTEALTEAVKILAQALVRTASTLKRIHPVGQVDDRDAFVRQAAKDIGDALAVEEH